MEKPKEKKTEKSILAALSESGPATRFQLALTTGIPRSTLYDSLIRLKLQGMVASHTEIRNSRGRPRVYYSVIYERPLTEFFPKFKSRGS